ncbi:MAG: DUF814 domain-containing protein [Deltaproteobacteria bacterium]|nr:DUF814 domain-containing protein [Deltaproteobacteria bacterium]
MVDGPPSFEARAVCFLGSYVSYRFFRSPFVSRLSGFVFVISFMTLDAKTLAEVIRELRPLVGGRIQRIDLMAEREVVLEVRIPGRTVRLLASAEPGVGRVHVIPQRGVRQAPAGPLQGVLRQRLVGKVLTALSADGRTVVVAVPDMHLRIRLDGGRDAFRLLPGDSEGGRSHEGDGGPADAELNFPVSEAIARLYEARRPISGQLLLRQEMDNQLRRRKKKLERLFENLKQDRTRLTEMSERAREAELLKPLLSAIKRGQAFVDALDYVTGESVRVVLDPSLSAKDNMLRLFDRAKKGDRGRPRVEARLEETRLEIDALERALEALFAIDLGELADFAARIRPALLRGDGVAPHTVEGPLGADGRRPSRDRLKDAGRGPRAREGIDRWARRFVAKDGSEILVGRGAKENDRLTLSVARGNDLWLHARGTTGAHVVLRRRSASSQANAAGGSNVTGSLDASSASNASSSQNDALLDAANLAVHYSGLKTDSKAEVTVTEARNVRKNKGDPPGRVQVARSRTLLISPDSERIDRLFGRGR